jgi:hypothetical protein
VSESPTAVLYDIHGNLAALEAVLAEAEQAGVMSYLLGGDYAAAVVNPGSVGAAARWGSSRGLGALPGRRDPFPAD